MNCRTRFSVSFCGIWTRPLSVLFVTGAMCLAQSGSALSSDMRPTSGFEPNGDHVATAPTEANAVQPVNLPEGRVLSDGSHETGSSLLSTNSQNRVSSRRGWNGVRQRAQEAASPAEPASIESPSSAVEQSLNVGVTNRLSDDSGDETVGDTFESSIITVAEDQPNVETIPNRPPKSASQLFVGSPLPNPIRNPQAEQAIRTPLQRNLLRDPHGHRLLRPTTNRPEGSELEDVPSIAMTMQQDPSKLSCAPRLFVPAGMLNFLGIQLPRHEPLASLAARRQRLVEDESVAPSANPIAGTATAEGDSLESTAVASDLLETTPEDRGNNRLAMEVINVLRPAVPAPLLRPSSAQCVYRVQRDSESESNRSTKQSSMTRDVSEPGEVPQTLASAEDTTPSESADHVSAVAQVDLESLADAFADRSLSFGSKLWPPADTTDRDLPKISEPTDESVPVPESPKRTEAVASVELTIDQTVAQAYAVLPRSNLTRSETLAPATGSTTVDLTDGLASDQPSVEPKPPTAPDSSSHPQESSIDSNVKVDSNEPQELRLSVRGTQLISAEAGSCEAQVEDTNVCDVVRFNRYQISVIGKQSGSTRIHLRSARGDVFKTTEYLVTVSPRHEPARNGQDQYAKLRQLLKYLYPDCDVCLTPKADRLFVTGSAPSRKKAIEILTMIRSVRIIPVIDQLTVEDGSKRKYVRTAR